MAAETLLISYSIWATKFLDVKFQFKFCSFVFLTYTH